MNVLAFEPKKSRGTWGTHCVPAFYLGPAMDAYRCHKVYVPSTRAERTTDSLAWLPAPFRLPGSEPLEIVAAAIRDLILALNAANTFTPALQTRVNTLLPQLSQQLLDLQEIFSPTPTDAPIAEITNPAPLQRVPPTENVQAAPLQRVPPTENVQAAPLQRVPSPTPAPTTTVPAQRVPAIHPAAAAPPAPTAIPPPIPGQPSIRDRKRYRRKPTHHPKPQPANAQPTLATPTIPAAPPAGRERKPNPRYASVNTLIFEKESGAPFHQAFPVQSASQVGHPPVIPIVCAVTQSLKTPSDTPANSVLPSLTVLRRGPDGHLWDKAHNTAIRKLIEETKTMKFIPWNHTKKPKYYKPVCKIKVDDAGNPYQHVRGTVADTHSTYDGPTSAQTASMATVKILLNSVVSTPGAKFCTADIKDYYLASPMDKPEFMIIALSQLSQEIIDQYDLNAIAFKNQVMVQIDKGMYGLAQAGRLAQDKLLPHLLKHGYILDPSTPMLFKHRTRPIAFTLVVDDFGIKYLSTDDTDHLFATLRKLYTITTDMSGGAYLGLTIAHNTKDHTIDISIPHYVNDAIQRFAPELLGSKGKQAPMRYHPFVYGPHSAESLEEDSSPSLDSTRTTRLQAIIGTFLYYARALDITCAYPMAKMSSLPHTEHTEELAYHFLEYIVAHPDAHVTFHRSNMQLEDHSDASFNCETKGRSRGTGYFYLGHYDPSKSQPPNGFIDYICVIISVIVASAMEAELAAVFLNAQHALTLVPALEFLGHRQDPTLIVSDNLVGVNILNGDTMPKRSRSMDIRFFWIKDRISQKQFKLSWAPGPTNLADYISKIHTAKHYREQRSKFVSDPVKSKIDSQSIERVY